MRRMIKVEMTLDNYISTLEEEFDEQTNGITVIAPARELWSAFLDAIEAEDIALDETDPYEVVNSFLQSEDFIARQEDESDEEWSQRASGAVVANDNYALLKY